MYRSSAIVKQWTDREGTNLETEEDCRMAMVWIALLGGGDYAPEGLTGFGKHPTTESTEADDQAQRSPMPWRMRVWPTSYIDTRPDDR